MRTLLLLMALLLAAVPAPARPGPLLVILLPGASLRDWRNADAPHLHRLMATGALAVMNTRSARLPNDRQRESWESAALTLGAGARATGVPESEAFQSASAPVPGLNLPSGEVYARRMGCPPPPNAAVNVKWPALEKANTGRGYDLQIGNLADALAKAGVPLRAGGGPLAALVAANRDGEVTPALSLHADTNECVVWDAGRDLPAADRVIERALAQTEASGGRLIVLSPCAGDFNYRQGRRLTPILEWGADVPAGLLQSPSTHRLGLVTDTDFAPTVAAYFGVTRFPTAPFGRAWTAVPAVGAERQVGALEEQSYRQAQGMRLLPYLAVFFALWIGTGTALAAAGRMPAFWPLAPPALLLAVLLSTSPASAATLIPLCGLGSGVALRFLGTRRALLATLTLLAAGMIVDMTTGGNLMQRSLLGYSAVEGARYYGIGNEAMGVLVAALLVLTAGLWSVPRLHLPLTLLLIMVAVLLGSPWGGAKAGGLLVSLAAFGTLLYSLWGGRWSPRVGLLMTLSVILTMAVVAAADAFWPGHVHSHVGEAVRRIQAGGLVEGEDVAARKLAVEGRLAYHSAWALLLWGGLGCWLKNWKSSGKMTKEQRALDAAGLVAVAACLFLNDAGVVAAALCVVVLWSASAGEMEKEKPSQA